MAGRGKHGVDNDTMRRCTDRQQDASSLPRGERLWKLMACGQGLARTGCHGVDNDIMRGRRAVGLTQLGQARERLSQGLERAKLGGDVRAMIAGYLLCAGV